MLFLKKKNQGPYPRTFAKRLTKRIMLTLFITMSVVSAIIYGIAWAVVYSNAYILSEYVLSTKRQPTEKILTEVYTAAVNTVPDIENSLSHPQRLHSIMKRIVELNPNVQSCGLSFRESYYPEKGRWFCPYALRSDSTVIIQTLDGTRNDYLKEEWFLQALKSPQPYWSKPFFTGKDKNIPLVAYLVPIRDSRDSIVAVLGVDVSLTKLFPPASIEERKDTTAPWDASDEIYFFAIDSTGTYLRHIDKQRIVRKNIFDYTKKTAELEDDSLAIAMIAVGKSGDTKNTDNEELTLEGEDVLVSYRPLEHTSWTMGLVLPRLVINVITWLLGGFLLFFILLGLIVVYFGGRRGIKKVSNPLRQLAASADEVAKGNFDAALPEVHTKDEIHQLRDSFENMQQSLILYTDELRMTTAAKVSMESELKIAHDIQMSMLPKTFPPYPDRDDVDIYGSLTPAKGVGGDLFDFFIRDEKLFFCIGDVSGKGVPASLYMAVTRSLFRNVSGYISEPDRIVEALNKAQNEGNDTNMFVTIFVGVLDLQTGVLNYCNGGHDAPLLVGRDVGELPCDPNLPIGVIGDFKFSQQQVNIDTNTTIFLFTDGLNEAENARHQQFGDQRIWNVARRLLSENSHQPEHMIEQMTQAVHEFVGDAEQSDDLTMLAIQYKK